MPGLGRALEEIGGAAGNLGMNLGQGALDLASPLFDAAGIFGRGVRGLSNAGLGLLGRGQGWDTSSDALLRNLGIVSSDYQDTANPTFGRTLAGIGTDIATDPLTYLLGPLIGRLGRGRGAARVPLTVDASQFPVSPGFSRIPFDPAARVGVASRGLPAVEEATPAATRAVEDVLFPRAPGKTVLDYPKAKPYLGKQANIGTELNPLDFEFSVAPDTMVGRSDTALRQAGGTGLEAELPSTRLAGTTLRESAYPSPLEKIGLNLGPASAEDMATLPKAIMRETGIPENLVLGRSPHTQLADYLERGANTRLGADKIGLNLGPASAEDIATLPRAIMGDTRIGLRENPLTSLGERGVSSPLNPPTSYRKRRTRVKPWRWHRPISSSAAG